MNKYLITASSVLCVLVISTGLFQLFVHKHTGHAKSAEITTSIEAKQAIITPIRIHQCHNCYQLSIDKGIVRNKKRTNKTAKNRMFNQSAYNHSTILPNYTKPNATLIKGKEIIPINLIKIQVINSKINYYFNTIPESQNPLPLCGNIPGMSRFKACSELFDVKIHVLCNSNNHILCKEMTNA